MKKQSENATNSFTIAHYILMFLVAVLCASIVVWLIIGRQENEEKIVVAQIENSDPCVQQALNIVGQMWAYNQELIPVKYLAMVDAYVNEPVPVRVTGYCEDVVFTCRPGQVRRVCNPCAVSVGRQIAMEKHVADIVQSTCNDDM